MTKKEFLDLEKNVLEQKYKMARESYYKRLNKLLEEEQILLSSLKVRELFRSIYCGYHLNKANFILGIALPLFAGFYLIKVLLLVNDFGIKTMSILIISLILIGFSINYIIAPVDSKITLTEEDIYDRIINIEQMKKELDKDLADQEKRIEQVLKKEKDLSEKES